jgi:hypothetical protein
MHPRLAHFLKQGMYESDHYTARMEAFTALIEQRS